MIHRPEVGGIYRLMFDGAHPDLRVTVCSIVPGDRAIVLLPAGAMLTVPWQLLAVG